MQQMSRTVTILIDLNGKLGILTSKCWKIAAF